VPEPVDGPEAEAIEPLREGSGGRVSPASRAYRANTGSAGASPAQRVFRAPIASLSGPVGPAVGTSGSGQQETFQALPCTRKLVFNLQS
jgi:hypothetical protein